MVTVYFVIAAFLYWPFKNWLATAEEAAISALLWPLMVVFILWVLITAPFIKNKD